VGLIFVVCAETDRQRVEPTLQRLRSAGHRLWIAGPDLDWRYGAAQSLAEVKSALLFISRAGLAAAPRRPLGAWTLLPHLPNDELAALLRLTPETHRPAGARFPEPSAVRAALAAALGVAEQGWTLFDALAAIAGAKLTGVLIDATLAVQDLPAPLQPLQIIDLPLAADREPMGGRGINANSRARGEAALLRAVRRRLDRSAEALSLGAAMNGAAKPRAHGLAGAAALAAACGLLGGGASVLALGQAAGAGGGLDGATLEASLAPLRAGMQALQDRFHEVDARSRLADAVEARQGALLFALSANIHDPAMCRQGERVAPLELAAVSDRVRRDAAAPGGQGPTFASGDGIWSIARKVYGPNPDRVANLIYFANLEAFCAGGGPNVIRADEILVPRLSEVLNGLTPTPMAGPRAADQGSAAGSP